MSKTYRNSPGVVTESVDVRKLFGQSRYKPEPDDLPARSPRDRNTGAKPNVKQRSKVGG